MWRTSTSSLPFDRWPPTSTGIARTEGRLLLSSAWSRTARLALVAAGVGLVVYPLAGLAPAAPATPLLYVPPVAINLLLAALFARTLVAQREPMISRFARLERGRLEPDLVGYTRLLTWVWVLFFLAMAALSVVLAWLVSYRAWAWFASVGNYVCVAALFIGEYLYRRRRFAHYEHLSPVALWRIVRKALRSTS